MAGLAEQPWSVTGAAGGPLSFWADERGSLERRLDRERMADVLRSGRGQLWVDVDSRREDEWLLLTELFGFHPLAVEDTRSPNCRVKIEEYDGYLFVVVRGLRFATRTPEPYDIQTSNLYLFLGPNYVVTVHGEESRAVEVVVERLEAGPELLARGAEHLAYVVIDTLVDFYFPFLDEIDGFVDELEDAIFHDGSGALERIFELKRLLLVLRRQLAPMREVMATLANRPSPHLGPETQVYFRDVYDHVVRQVESLETYRDLLSGAMEMHLSMLSNRLNEVTKVLSAIATVILPATLIASIYGMNFRVLPLAGHPYGFWIMLGIMGVVGSGLVLVMRWKRWL